MQTQPIRVIIADDHDIFRDGLKVLLGKDKDIVVIAEASDGRQLIELLDHYTPDVILTDLIMPGMTGIESIKVITQKHKNIKLVAISTYDSEQLIVEALEAGASGYVSKNAQRNEIVEAVKTVYHHHPYYCSSTTLRLAKLISRSLFNPYEKLEAMAFSEREVDIIRLICQEKTSEEIGKILFMSKKNVDTVRSKILVKMHVKTLAGVAIYAIKRGIVLID